MMKKCEHKNRAWYDHPKIINNSYNEMIGIKSKCLDCGKLGYEFFKFNSFEVGLE